MRWPGRQATRKQDRENTMGFRNGILAAVAAAVLAFSQGADAKTFKWAFQGSKLL